MKNILSIVVFTLILANFSWAQQQKETKQIKRKAQTSKKTQKQSVELRPAQPIQKENANKSKTQKATLKSTESAKREED